MKLSLLLSLSLLLWAAPAQAAQWQATQGDVVTVETSYDGDTLALTCFGKRWPLKALGQGLSLIHNLRAHETKANLVCRLLLEKKKKTKNTHRNMHNEPHKNIEKQNEKNEQ